YVLVHGAAYAQRFAQWKGTRKLPIIGYPRYDDCFGGKVDSRAFLSRWPIEAGRATIVYLPTWGDNSSFEAFFPAVAVLAAHFNVLVRPHHCTLRMEPQRMKALKDSGVAVIDNAYDLSALLSVADGVVADTRSGAFFESLMLGRRTLGLVVNSQEISE